MANTLTAILPKIMARSLLALRNETVLPALVRKDFSLEPARKGAAITIETPTAVTTLDVAPSSTPISPSNTTPVVKTLTLDKWRQSAPFHLTDQELTQIDVEANFLPSQMSEAVAALADYVNAQIFALYTGIYGWAGTPGVTPFNESTPVIDVASNAVKILNAQKAPRNPRFGVLGPTAAAAARNLPAFNNASAKGSTETIVEGNLGRVMGIDWKEDQQVPSHANTYTGTPLVDSGAGYAVGIKTIHMDGFTAAPGVGDVFTIPARASGVVDEQTYVVVSATVLAGSDTDVTFEPGLKVALAAGDDNQPVIFKGNHAVNLAFHRDAIGFASRPLLDTDPTGKLGVFFTMPDPVSGLVLRLELARQHKQTIWEFDILFGCALIRPELACRIAGIYTTP